MIYELFLEGELADIRQDLGMQLNFNIDDINKYGSRDTSFSKTIILPGTAKNNRLLGFVSELGSFNPYINGSANINSNFNAAQTTKAELRANGLLLLKGVFRLTGIVKDRDLIEYEGNLFGELGGFVANIGGRKLEDLDFSEYNHNYTRNNIVSSWDGKLIKNVNGYFDNGVFTDEIGVYGFNLNLKNGDIITITNATDSGNNGTYTVLFSVYNESTNLNKIFFTSGLSSDDPDDNFTIEYPSSNNYGSGYYYPLIDHGRYSTDKKDYDYRTFRPALFVKEYIDKIFEDSGYTYESNFFGSAFFKKLIVPCNISRLTKLVSDLLNANRISLFNIEDSRSTLRVYRLPYTNISLTNNFTGNGNPNFIYIGPPAEVEIVFNIKGYVNFDVNFFDNGFLDVRLRVAEVNKFIRIYKVTNTLSFAFNESITFNVNLNTNDTIYVFIQAAGTWNPADRKPTAIESSSISIKATNPVTADIQLNDPIILNSLIPRNILQLDFFTWLVKMFNLYVTEDKIKSNHLLIEPYKDYYDLSSSIDWTYKVARDKPWQIKPMGMLNGRFFEYKFKTDNDYYNENFRKKFGMSYGDILQDTGFQFAKQKQTLEIGFSPSVLVQYSGTDKVVAAIYKLTKGNAVEQEEWIESNIRVMMAKKITGISSWTIRDKGVTLDQNPGTALGASLTAYGYAGHFDDPVNPTVDINFGAASEIYFDPLTYASANLFNKYWSGYIAEIADKDSKLLMCHVYLTELDIAQLDFSKFVFIDGVLWRINKIIDFDASSGELTKVELLKVIDSVDENLLCSANWTKENYKGTTFRNGDPIPEVTDSTAWANLTTPAWCYYNNDSANEATYGKLYNWYAINDPRGFAPIGYRVPNDNDWNSLIDCLGGSAIAGGKMKSTTGWDAPNTGATNESGFSGLPAGGRTNAGVFNSIGFGCSWWSLTEISSTRAGARYLSFDTEDILNASTLKKNGASVRLIKE